MITRVFLEVIFNVYNGNGGSNIQASVHWIRPFPVVCDWRIDASPSWGRDGVQC